MSADLTQTPDLELPPTSPAPAAAPGRRRSIAYLAGALAGGNALALVFQMVGGVLQASCVEPAVLGMFGGIGLVLEYISFAQLGVLNGLSRELPYFIGKGEHDRVRSLAAAAQAWAVLIGVLAAGGMTVVAVFQLAQGNWWLSAGWFTHAVLAFILFYSTNYLQVTFRTGHDFARLAMVNVVHAGLLLVLVLLVWLMSFYGLCLRVLIAAVVMMVMLHHWRPVRVRPKWNFGHLKHLAVIGLPIFGVGLLYGYWATIDRTMVLFSTSVEDTGLREVIQSIMRAFITWDWPVTERGQLGLGLFYMVFQAVRAMEVVPTAVSQVIYPRMAEQFGRNGRIRDLLRMAAVPMFLTVLGMIAAVAVGWWLVEPVVRLIAWKYLPAVPAMRWGMLAAVVYSFAPLNNLFNVVRRQDLYFLALVAGIACYVASLFWLFPRGAPVSEQLVAFPQAMLIGRAVFMLCSYFFLARLVRKERAA